MSSSRRPGKRAYLMISGFALLLVLFPFWFWYSTWFGRKLSDSDIDRYFADSSKPRHAQHALVQVGERLTHHQDASRWYPQIVQQASSPNLELRQTAAWIMGQDRNYPPFHVALLQLIHDTQPMVRRNAALALAAFGDEAARPELVAMLRPYTMTAPASGMLKYRLKVGDYVNPGTMVGHIGEAEVRSAIPGEVRALDHNDNTAVRNGEALLDLGPDPNHVWEALRGLYLVGQAADLEDVRRFTRPVSSMPEAVLRQAQSTAEAIESRKSAQ